MDSRSARSGGNHHAAARRVRRGPAQAQGPAQLDFGDAPATYPVLLADDGARHVSTSGLFLGSSIDSELDGQPGPATGDDTTGTPDDEDGVAFPAALFPGASQTVIVTTDAAGLLDAWVDWNADGD